jgi:hypothetical protein
VEGDIGVEILSDVLNNFLEAKVSPRGERDAMPLAGVKQWPRAVGRSACHAALTVKSARLCAAQRI